MWWWWRWWWQCWFQRENMRFPLLIFSLPVIKLLWKPIKKWRESERERKLCYFGKSFVSRSYLFSLGSKSGEKERKLKWLCCSMSQNSFPIACVVYCVLCVYFGQVSALLCYHTSPCSLFFPRLFLLPFQGWSIYLLGEARTSLHIWEIFPKLNVEYTSRKIGASHVEMLILNYLLLTFKDNLVPGNFPRLGKFSTPAWLTLMGFKRPWHYFPLFLQVLIKHSTAQIISR